MDPHTPRPAPPPQSTSQSTSQSTAQSTAASQSAAVRRARIVTYGLMVAMVGTVATGTENWPLSQFELFSGVRTGESVSRQLIAVNDRGTESPVDLSELPPNLGLVSHLLPTLRDEDPATQRQVMRLWLDAVGADDPEPAAVRVYVVRSTVPTVAGGRSAVLDRTFSYEVPLR